MPAPMQRAVHGEDVGLPVGVERRLVGLGLDRREALHPTDVVDPAHWCINRSSPWVQARHSIVTHRRDGVEQSAGLGPCQPGQLLSRPGEDRHLYRGW